MPHRPSQSRSNCWIAVERLWPVSAADIEKRRIILGHWQLHRAVKPVNRMPRSLGLEKHPDKTLIGRIERPKTDIEQSASDVC
jgi:hypothetical protein